MKFFACVYMCVRVSVLLVKKAKLSGDGIGVPDLCKLHEVEKRC